MWGRILLILKGRLAEGGCSCDPVWGGGGGKSSLLNGKIRVRKERGRGQITFKREGITAGPLQEESLLFDKF